MNEEAEESRGEIHQIVSQGCRTCDYWDAENYHCMLNIPIHLAYPCRITDKIIELGYRKPVDRPELREGIERILQTLFGEICTNSEVFSGYQLSHKVGGEFADQILALYNKGEPPLLSAKEMREYFEKQIPKEQRNELFDLLTIDYMTELLMAAKAQRESDIACEKD